MEKQKAKKEKNKEKEKDLLKLASTEVVELLSVKKSPEVAANNPIFSFCTPPYSFQFVEEMEVIGIIESTPRKIFCCMGEHCWRKDNPASATLA